MEAFYKKYPDFLTAILNRESLSIFLEVENLILEVQNEHKHIKFTCALIVTIIYTVNNRKKI